jgi:glycine cleavage system H lipoate-binding protein
VNTELATTPELVNQSPYDHAWFVEMEVDGGFDASRFLDAAAYSELTE